MHLLTMHGRGKGLRPLPLFFVAPVQDTQPRRLHMKQLVVIGAMALTLIAFHAGAAQAETLSVGTTAGLPQDVVQLTDQELSSIEGSGSPFGGPGGPFASGGESVLGFC